MYKFERNSRIYMGADGQPAAASSTSPTQHNSSSSRPSSRSPLQGINKSSPHHKSNTAIHTNGHSQKENCNGTPIQTKSLRDSQHRAISSELGDLTAPGETKTKTQMARAFQETQELYKSADQKAGLQTVKTVHVRKKTTTITRGENEKLEDNSNFREILLRWAQKTTDGYPGCNVTDLTTSWRNGLAFNAIIHRNRPDLLDYRACRKKTSRENLDQAFTVADRDLGCARLLEPEEVDVPNPDEKSMITYLSQLYELFPDPPERNPLLDEEAIRRIDEYKELASRLLKWIKDSTMKLEDRRFPKNIAELKDLKKENERWKNEEVPPKQHDKARCAKVAPEIYKMAQDVGVKIPGDLHMDNIDYHWDRMMNAHRARGQALDDELAKAERLKALLDKLLNDIRRTNDRLDGIERDMSDGEQRVARMQSPADANEYSAEKLRKISEELADVGIKIDSIKRLANDFINEAGRTSPDSVMVREKVAELDARYKRLLSKLGHLHDQYDRAVKRLKEMEDAHRRSQAQREAEAKLRLKLDAMKRELDELEYRIDNMGPVAKDLPTLRKQLAELNKFDEDLSRARKNLNDLIKLAEDMIKDDLIADPTRLRMDLQALKDQLARIEEKASRRLRDFEEALKRAEARKEAEAKLQLKLDAMKRELDELEHRIDNMGPIAKDLPTLRKQLAELNKFDEDLNRTRNNLNDLVNLAEDMIRDDLIDEPARLRMDLKSLKDQLNRIADKSAKRMRDLQEALKRAEAQEEAGAKLQLKLDAMKRELDELEHRIDNMAPVAKDLPTLHKQLAELNKFEEDLKRTRDNLNDLIKLAEGMIKDDLIADPSRLRTDLKALKDQLARIAEKAGRRLRDIQDAMSRVAASDAIKEVAQWLDRAKRVLINEENVHGDLDTVNALIEQHKAFQAELEARQPTMNEVRRMEQELSRASPQNGAIVRDELSSLSQQWRDVEKLTREKSAKLGDALRLAEQLHKSVHALLEWLADAEMKLRFAGSLPEDEVLTKQEIGEHEKLMRKMSTQGQTKEQTLKLAREILNKCHPDAEPVIKHWINIIESRWDEIEQWAKQRGQKLADHLRSLKELLELVEELVGWLARHEGRLLAEEKDNLPDNANQLDSLIDQHSNFMDELRKREPDIDRVVKVFAAKSNTATSKMILTTTTTKPRQTSAAGGRSSGGARSTTPTRTSYATYKDEYPEVKHPRARVMLEKWRSVWQLALDKMQRLKDRFENLKEAERMKLELEDAPQAEKQVPDDQLIQDELQKQVDKCTCQQRYKVYHVGEGRYRFGESQKLRLVRILRSTVMVRVGGGWETLTAFLQKNDPCRAKGRTNVELREQFILPEGASQAMAAFKSRMSKDPGSMPALGPITKIREKTDKSLPMSSSRYGSPSDYYSETESTSRARGSRIGRLTPASASQSRPSSRPNSRHGSDMA